MDIDPCEEQFPFEVQRMEEHDDVSIFIVSPARFSGGDI